jgi:chromosome segregation ATPase
MDKKDVIINELNKKIEQMNKEQSELMEEIEELELVNKTLTETVEIFQTKLKDKDALIGVLKDNLNNCNKEILHHLLDGKGTFRTIKFIIERMGL